VVGRCVKWVGAGAVRRALSGASARGSGLFETGRQKELAVGGFGGVGYRGGCLLVPGRRYSRRLSA
jgi:hypothetical protein